MSMRLSFCVQAATSLDGDDLDALTAGIEGYVKAGLDERQAETLALDDLIALVAAERTAVMALVRAQHPDLFTAPAPVAASPEPSQTPAAAAILVAPTLDRTDLDATMAGYTPADVAQAAKSAGISAQSLASAIAEAAKGNAAPVPLVDQVHATMAADPRVSMFLAAPNSDDNLAAVLLEIANDTTVKLMGEDYDAAKDLFARWKAASISGPELEEELRLEGLAKEAPADDPGLEATLNAKALFAGTRFDAGERGTPRQAMRDALELLGFDPGARVEVVDVPDRPDMPMRYDLATRTVHYNAAAEHSRVADVEYMLEELLHALDHVGGERTISASNPKFLAQGEIRTELEQSPSAALQDFLKYPLRVKEYSETQIAAELFARVGVLYHADPRHLKVAAPNTFAAYEQAFGHRAGARSLRGEVRPDPGRVGGGPVLPESAAEVGGAGGQGQRAAAGDASGRRQGRADGLQRAREAVAERVGGSVAGATVQFGNSRKRLETRTVPGQAQRRPIAQAVRGTLSDMLGNAGAKVSWWDKTLGTQYAKAQKFPELARVSDRVQQFLEDTSSMANEAANEAGDILPKLDTWKDLKNIGLSSKDAEAIAGPIFTGTLTDKKVYSDGELRSRYNLNAEQIGHYRQFLRAVNTSLDQAVTADVLRVLGDKNPMLRDLALTDRALFRSGVTEYLEQEAAAGDTTAADMLETIQDKYAKLAKLKEEGYTPLMRFGEYKVHVVNAAGETEFFGLYETKAAANRMARELAEDPAFAGMRFERGVLSKEQYKLFSGVPLDSMEMFANAIGADKSEVFQQFLKVAKNNRSALKRLIQRKGTAGFSEDVPRVLAAFVTSNARMAAGAMNLNGAKAAAQEIRDGDVQDEAIKLIEAAENPQETAGFFRGLMFINFIGGSIASAVVNLTQPITMTLPYLSQWGGLPKAGARLMAAGKMVSSGNISDAGLADALKRAEQEGIVSPQEIHHLTAQATGAWGTHPIFKRFAFIWGAPFSLAEQFNRRVSFIAAFNTAQEEGIQDAFGFAEKAVTETQGLYNKGNVPNWARNPVGAAALTFKQFSIHYLEWMVRMYRSGPNGKRAVVYALALLMVAAGSDGVPFADDLDDLIDTIGQALGYDTNAKRARREFMVKTLGMSDEAADVVARGFSALPGIPMDVSLRMGMGNLLPATGMLLRSNTDRARDVLELAGPAGGLLKQYADAAQKGLAGSPGEAALGLMPVAIQNVGKAVGMWVNGEARDTQDRRIMDADLTDGLMRFLGFNPQAIARESEKMQIKRRSEQLAKNVEGEIAGRWARAFADGDRDAVDEARRELADWNAANPEARIVITGSQILARVKKLRQDRAQRFITSAAPERRAQVREGLQ
jgi:hypothetical protein